MPFCPASLRRSGYDLPASSSRQQAGFCLLPARHQHALAAFLANQPPRVVAELILQVAADRLDVPAGLALVDDWRGRLDPAAVRAAGGDKFPRRQIGQVPA